MTSPTPPLSAHEAWSRMRVLLLCAELIIVQGGLAAWLHWNLGRDQVPFEPALFLVLVPFQVMLFLWRGAINFDPFSNLTGWIRAGLEGLAGVILALMACVYATGQAPATPRLAVLSWAITSIAGVIALRSLVWWTVHRRHDLVRRLVLVGDLHRCLMVEAQLLSAGGSTRPVGVVITDEDGQAHAPAFSVPILPFEDLGPFSMREGVDRVLICAQLGDEALVDRVMNHLMSYPVEVSLVPDLTRFPVFCLRVEQEGTMPVVNLSASPMRPQDVLLKRIEDLVLASLILVVISIPMLVIAALIKLTSPGPVFFVQNRHGFMGKTIRVLKFRTMVALPPSPPVPGQPAPVTPDPVPAGTPPGGSFLEPSTGSHFRQAVAGDMRITPLGRIMRRFSIDEIPQFINVLMGDMSVVGPRPHARSHNLEFLASVPYLMRRHYVKPGVTGLAQIQGARGRTAGPEDMRRRVSLDLEYIRRWSLWLDCKIIVSTIFGGFYTREP